MPKDVSFKALRCGECGTPLKKDNSRYLSCPICESEKFIGLWAYNSKIKVVFSHY